MSLRNIAWFLVLLGFVPLPVFVSRGNGDTGAPRFPVASFQARIQAALEVHRACAQEGWREEFDNVCADTDIAMTLSKNELSERIGRCDRLKARIEAEEESTRKVYLRRLQMCQDFYLFMLQSKPPDR
jgi:hypothetical protein